MELEGLSLKAVMDSSGIVRGANESADALDDLSESVERSSTSMAGAADQMSSSAGEMGASFDSAARSGTGLEQSIDGVSSSQGELASSNTTVSTTLDAYTKDAGEAAEASEKVAASQGRVTEANSKATMSTKDTALAMTQVATSAMALYGAYDAVGDAQLALDRANLQVEKSQREVDSAQKTYNDTLAKYGETAIETQLASENLRLKQEEVKLNTDAAANAQENYNEKMVQAGLTIIPAVISGVDGLSKAWKGLQSLDLTSSIGSINDVLKAHRGAIISAGAGLAAVAVIYGAFTTTSQETRIGLSLLAGGLVAAAAAQWVWNAATAFGLGLTGAGLILVGVAGAAAATVYALSSKYGAEIEENAANAKVEGVQGYGTDTTAALMREKGWEWDAVRGTWYNANDASGYASGGISSTPQLAAVSEGGEPEIHLTRRNIQEFGLRGGNTITINLYGVSDPQANARAIAEQLERGGV